jgi:hypothetical protein
MILQRYIQERVYLPTATPGSIYKGARISGPAVMWGKADMIAKCLELAWRGNAMSSDPDLASCIPEGIYLVRREEPNQARNYKFFRIIHVPGRNYEPAYKASNCLYHPANFADQLLGCITPGSRHVDLNNDGVIDIEDSKRKLAWMVENMPALFEMEIRKKTA